MASKSKKQFLTLKKKVEVIRTVKKNRGMGVRELGEIFNCSKTQVAKILKKRDS